MAQFKQYSSGDIGSPILNGTSGSLLNLFNQCLVTGYGAKQGAGWIKQMPDTGSFGMFTQPSGSNLSLFINDTCVGVAGAKNARASGYVLITSVDISGNPTGSNPFPSSGQQTFGNNVGSVIIRKSTTIDSVPRPWKIFADDRTFYYFAQTENFTSYNTFFFGDIYSFYTGSDDYKCIIVGGNNDQSSYSPSYYSGDRICLVNTTCTGHFMAKTYNGTGNSILVGKHGDSNRFLNDPNSSTYYYIQGGNQYPNGTDMGLYMTPLYINESSGIIRGKLRGQYSISHALTNFTDGQQFNGNGDFAGRTFQIIKTTEESFGVYCIEVSNTLDTN